MPCRFQIFSAKIASTVREQEAEPKMNPRPAIGKFLQKQENKSYIVIFAGAVCGIASYIFCFHKVIFALFYFSCLFSYLFTKPQPSLANTCALGYCYTTILVGVYTIFQKFRTGVRPTWPINYEDDVTGFTTGCILVSLSSKLIELCGSWGNLFCDAKWRIRGVGCYIFAMSLRIIATTGGRWAWPVGLEVFGYFIVLGQLCDAAYQEGCKNGTEIWPQDLFSAVFRGRLPALRRKVDEERRRQKAILDEKEREKLDGNDKQGDNRLDPSLSEEV